MTPSIRVLVPDMPTADELLPFLREMDQTRVYCNNGPLVDRLERQIEDLHGLCFLGIRVCAVSSGTAALELSLKALGRLRGTPVAVPALTFRATAQAVVNAGMFPVFCDVDPVRFHMHPESVPKGIDVALPVATYGVALDVAEWARWASRSPSRRVVMDCAGSFGDQLTPVSPQMLLCFSLHATKFVGAGEGGLVSGTDELLDVVRKLSSFGDVCGASNYRMSEYHAAVALASLRPEHRKRKSAKLAKLSLAYAAHLGTYCRTVVSLRSQTLGSCSSLFVIELPDMPGANSAVAAALLGAGIETRLWYRPFPQELNSLTGLQSTMPPVTARAVGRHLGLPFHTFMDESEVAQVCRELSSALSKLP